MLMGREKPERILKDWKSAIEVSETAGKTFGASFAIKIIGLCPFVIYMKSAIRSWKKALLGIGFESEDIFVNNYEQWTRGNCFKYYDLWRFKETSKNSVIVDEVYKRRNLKTKNARMLSKIKKSDACLLMLSVTAFETLDKSVTRASALGLCENTWKGKREWLVEHVYFSSRFGSNSLEFCGNRKYLVVMHKKIFPECDVRIRIRKVPGFPESIYMVD
jgi:hypothetical protein